jgi:hypothetical protein
LTLKPKDLRDWMFRGLMFEADADQFRAAGIRVGADTSDTERALLNETLDPFSIELRNEALQMGRLYSLVYCFENSLRALISQRLRDQHGDNWWVEKVPKSVREFAEERQRKATEDNSWLEGQKKDILGFVDFGRLSDIITNNWEDFADLIPTQHWLKQRLDELEQARNFIAHHRLLLPGEFQRIELYISDWNRSVGL